MPRLTGLVLCFCLLASPARGDDLRKKIEALIDAPIYKQAHWGLLVVEAKTGKVLYERNADKMFAPASVTKLYSCAAALVALGAEHRFQTPVYRRGEIREVRLSGDLILVAQGDLTLGGRTGKDGRMLFKDHDHTYANGQLGAELTPSDPLAGLRALARQIREAGIHEVAGEVLIDDRLFERVRGTGSGPDAVSPILVNDNLVDVVITPGDKAGEPARVTIRPETSHVQMDAQVRTVEKGGASLTTVLNLGNNRFSVRGQVPVGHKPIVRIFPVDDPTSYARTLFIEVLRREGVRVRASSLARPDAPLPEKETLAKLPRVACFTSPPLAEALKVTLKVSHNLYASTLPLLLAVKDGNRTLTAGLRGQGWVLKELGLDIATISFGGGAGGDNADRATPRATVELLRAMAKRSDWKVYKEALPILGVDGTLATVVSKDSPARGKVFAKTGTLTWSDRLNGRNLLRSKALAGVMESPRGELLFAFFVNDVPLPPSVTSTREGKALGRLCELFFEKE